MFRVLSIVQTKKGDFILKKSFHIQTINSLHDRFEHFVAPFRGPATKQPHRLRLVLHRTLESRWT